MTGNMYGASNTVHIYSLQDISLKIMRECKLFQCSSFISQHHRRFNCSQAVHNDRLNKPLVIKCEVSGYGEFAPRSPTGDVYI